MKIGPFQFALSAVACLSSLSVASELYTADRIDLAPKLTVDEIDRYDLTIDSDINMSLMGSTQTVASFMEARFSVKVTDTTADGGTVVITFERILVQFDGYAALDGSYDTASKVQPSPDEVLPRVVRPAIQKPITIELDGWGNMLSVSGLEALAPDGPAGALFLQLFSNDALYSMFQPVFRIRPQQDTEPISPVSAHQAVGSAWSAVQPEIQSLNVRRQMLELTLDSVQGSQASITIDGKPNERVPENAKGMPGVETTKATVTGSAVWDTTGGELDSLQSRSILEFGSESGGFAIDITVTSSSELDRID